MTPRRLLVLLVVAVLVIGAALWLAAERNVPRNGTVAGKVLPALAGALNSIDEVRVVTAADKAAVSLKRDEKYWRVMERDGYPADAAKLRRLLLALSELRTVEAKTSNPDNYARLGVEDLAASGAAGVRIDLVGLRQPTSLIVGKSAAGDSTYIRVAGSAQSLLAKPNLAVEREPRNWLNRSILDIPSERVQHVRVAVAGARPYEVTRTSREQTDFIVPNPPRGRKLSSPSAANSAAAALGGLTLDDVRRAQPGDEWTSGVQRAEYRLFDGTTVTVTGHKDGDRHLVRIAVGFDENQRQQFAGPSGAAAAAKDSKPATPKPEELRAAAQADAARVAGWVYEIPAYKFETLFQPLDDLLSKS